LVYVNVLQIQADSCMFTYMNSEATAPLSTTHTSPYGTVFTITERINGLGHVAGYDVPLTGGDLAFYPSIRAAKNAIDGGWCEPTPTR
jgi:hypothetical protein